MCPFPVPVQLQEHIDFLTGACENGASRGDAFMGRLRTCSALSPRSNAVGCGLCEGTLINRIWAASDSDLQVMCPSLSPVEVQHLIDTLEMDCTDELSRKDVRSAVGGLCMGGSSVEASVACALCGSTLVDRIWSD